MIKSFSFFIEIIVKKIFIIILLLFVCQNISFSQVVYVDSNTGNDNNTGTKDAPVFSIQKAAEIINSTDNDIYVMKINPGIYILNKHVSVTTKKEMTDKYIVIEASILPDSSAWTPDKMPVIMSISKKGEFTGEQNKNIVGFSIEENNVEIRGLKFLGYCYPVNKYFPIARFKLGINDLLVEQCMFVGDQQSSVIQVSIIANGNGINVNHCVFFNTNNSVVFYNDSGSGIKTGNKMTNCIVYGADESAIWTVKPDKDFVYKNNIVANCNFFWIKNPENTTTYSIDSCVIVDNKHYQGNNKGDVINFKMNEDHIIKKGKISLRTINTIWRPMPKDHLHIIPGTLGYDLKAGLFTK
jgi:hypothetical protein